MKFLLDTHTFIWYVTDDARLSSVALEVINNGSNEVLLSIASILEMAIKYSIGKLIFESSFELFIPRQLADNSFEVLDVKIEHLNVVANLPLHHRDPFDRLIISQQRVPLRLSSTRGRCSMVEQIPIVGRDKAFDSYSVQRLW